MELRRGEGVPNSVSRLFVAGRFPSEESNKYHRASSRVQQLGCVEVIVMMCVYGTTKGMENLTYVWLVFPLLDRVWTSLKTHFLSSLVHLWRNI